MPSMLVTNLTSKMRLVWMYL